MRSARERVLRAENDVLRGYADYERIRTEIESARQEFLDTSPGWKHMVAWDEKALKNLMARNTEAFDRAWALREQLAEKEAQIKESLLRHRVARFTANIEEKSA